jgi:hypothetical protein
MIFYHFYTNYSSSNEYSIGSLFIKYLEIAISRIIGRLSIPALYYISYFPTIDDFYGLTNVGIFSKIFDFNLYPDSVILFSYFSKINVEGSFASSIYIDAYCQYGWISLIFWSVVVGVVLFLLQNTLNKILNKFSFIVFTVFSIIYVYYFSQASIFRATLGYGGILFLFCWFLLFKRIKKS